MKAYPAYKELGFDFLHSVPQHWDITKLKYLSSVSFSSVDKHSFEEELSVRLCNYVDVYKNDLIKPNMHFMQATATKVEMDRFTLRQGDVLITKDSESWDDIAVPAYVTENIDGVLCGYHLALIRPSLIDGKYLFWVFSSSTVNDQYKVEAHGITRYGLGKDSIENSAIPVPSLTEQQAIADFLDCKTAQIDKLIGKKQRQIDLLQEQRIALINHAVTKGLNPDVSMKDSGVEWFEDIPSHWEVLPLKRVVNKFVDYRGHTPNKTDSGILLITARNIRDGYLDFETSREYIAEENYGSWMVRGMPEKGDVMVTTEAPLGATAQIESENVALAQRLILLKADKEQMDNTFLKYYFLSQSGQHELQSRSTGSTAIGIKASKFYSINVVIPPLNEQQKIVDHLEKESERILSLIANIEKIIEILQEYRTALISEAVTGKIDVRTETVHE